jgi:hypothetical protein
MTGVFSRFSLATESNRKYSAVGVKYFALAILCRSEK